MRPVAILFDIDGTLFSTGGAGARSWNYRSFCFGGCGSDSPDRSTLTTLAIRAGAILGRPIDPSDMIVVGDTPLDIEAAQTAGAISVAVVSGRYARDELERTGADHVLGSLGDLRPLRDAPARGGR